MDRRQAGGVSSPSTLVDAFTDLRSSLDACGFALISLEHGDRIALVNQPFLAMWGLRQGQLGTRMGPAARSLLADRFADRHRFLRFLDEVHSAPRPATEVFTTADGRTLEARAQPWIRAGVVAGTVLCFVDVTEHQQTQDLLRNSEARLWELATRDALTGLSNRRHLVERLEQEIQRARRAGEQLVVAMLDLDHFKRINDQLGHMEGDLVLRRFADVLRRRLRASDIVGRYGGEEFLCGLVATDLGRAVPVLDEVRRATRKLGDGRWNLSSSGGAACFPNDGDDVDRLIEVADRRLYAAKRAGRDRLVVSDDDRELRQSLPAGSGSGTA
ncbi:MAG TPA: GGDEF domain-containing protein [Myxococcales bacterium LLY-WYZ-16_1]|jgi:diguanylate cyclase (GGDEF)-like protein|nr:GGDEF domain-containing protein [Myxococcales bacterium LLY-WYZ-16_1]